MNPMLANNPYAQYQQAQVDTASPERLLLMLYDGAIRFGTMAKAAMDARDFATANRHCLNVQNILTEFMVTLKPEVDPVITQYLFDLYDYMHRRMIEANLSKDTGPIDEVLGHLKELRGAWAQAAINVATLKSTQATA